MAKRAREILKNERINSSAYTNLIGESVYYPNAGNLVIGTWDDRDHRPYDVDGTQPSLTDEDGVIWDVLICSCCGMPVKNNDPKLLDSRGRCSDPGCQDE
jgi:hypothetical protein